jgi:hypothetical protein
LLKLYKSLVFVFTKTLSSCLHSITNIHQMPPGMRCRNSLPCHRSIHTASSSPQTGCQHTSCHQLPNMYHQPTPSLLSRPLRHRPETRTYPVKRLLGSRRRSMRNCCRTIPTVNSIDRLDRCSRSLRRKIRRWRRLMRQVLLSYSHRDRLGSLGRSTNSQSVGYHVSFGSLGVVRCGRVLTPHQPYWEQHSPAGHA